MRGAFPKALRDHLTKMAVNTGVVWQRDGKPQIVIKLVNNLDFKAIPHK